MIKYDENTISLVVSLVRANLAPLEDGSGDSSPSPPSKIGFEAPKTTL